MTATYGEIGDIAMSLLPPEPGLDAIRPLRRQYADWSSKDAGSLKMRHRAWSGLVLTTGPRPPRLQGLG